MNGVSSGLDLFIEAKASWDCGGRDEDIYLTFMNTFIISLPIFVTFCIRGISRRQAISLPLLSSFLSPSLLPTCTLLTTKIQMAATITPIASLDWPTTPLQTSRIERAGTSYLAYESRLLNRRSFLHSSSFYQRAQNGSTNNDAESPAEEKKKEYDLLTMSERKLQKLNYYQVLQRNLPLHASADEIKKAYHKACLKYHPDKTGRGEEDEVFLLVKAAFDTLSDPVKRRSYDSTVDFDESIPKEGVDETEFYDVYGPVFERNLRFASFNDPAKQAVKEGGDMASPAGKKKKKKGGNKNNNGGGSKSSKESCPPFGDDSTPVDQVHAFYDFWVHFESWRDFTLKASKETEHDMDAADSRDEKRWMKQEIDRKIKKMKREEMARINLLVERAMAADPRLKREKEKERKEKQAKEEVRTA